MPGPKQLLGIGQAAGRVLARKAEKEAIEEIGARLAQLALKKAGSRITGKIAVGSRFWKNAFEHIAEHFVENAGKESHAVFNAALRSKDALEGLIKQAATKPSRKYLTKATIHGNARGRPVVVLEREFAEVIGRIGNDECRILRIVVDFTGRPVTAYPVAKLAGL